MTGRRYYITTLADWQRHTHRFANSHWLALDDSVYGAYHLSSDLLPLEPHLVLLESRLGISAPEAQQRIREWLVEAHRPGD